MRFKALKSFHWHNGKEVKPVKAGHVVEIEESYADEHLHPHGLVEETQEPLTAEVEAVDAKKKMKKVEKPAEKKEEKK